MGLFGASNQKSNSDRTPLSRFLSQKQTELNLDDEEINEALGVEDFCESVRSDSLDCVGQKIIDDLVEITLQDPDTVRSQVYQSGIAISGDSAERTKKRLKFGPEDMIHLNL